MVSLWSFDVIILLWLRRQILLFDYQVSYVMFILIYAYVITMYFPRFDSSQTLGGLSKVEVTLYFWIFTIIIEEMRQVSVSNRVFPFPYITQCIWFFGKATSVISKAKLRHITWQNKYYLYMYVSKFLRQLPPCSDTRERRHQSGSRVFIYSRRRFVTNHEKVCSANDHDRGARSFVFF